MDMLKSHRFAILLSVMFMLLVYALLFFSKNPAAPGDLINRELDSTIRHWLNGRLGVFFNFHFNGPLVWLSIPICLTWLCRKNNLHVPEYRFILFFIFFMVLFIAIFAYINYRYISGLTPLLLLLLIFSLWHVYPKPESTAFLRFMILASIIHTSIYLISEMAPRYLHRLRPLSEKSTSLPGKVSIWQTINDSCVSSVVLVNNLPEFYLRSNVSSVFCWMGDGVYYTRDGMVHFPVDATPELIGKTIQSLNCSFVFSSERLNEYNPAFLSFLNSSCHIVSKDADGLTLYRIHEN